MKNRRNAFTMIELVFVIVILGILASVAFPKFVATRDDAEVSKIAQNIGTSIMDIANYAVSQGKTDSNFSVMSNSMEEMEKSEDAALSNNEATISIGGVDCIKIKVDKNTTNNDLNVFYVDSSNQKCLSLQSTVNSTHYAIKLRGQNVVY